MELLPSSLWPVFFDCDCVTPSSGLRVYFDFISIFFFFPGTCSSLTHIPPPSPGPLCVSSCSSSSFTRSPAQEPSLNDRRRESFSSRPKGFPFSVFLSLSLSLLNRKKKKKRRLCGVGSDVVLRSYLCIQAKLFLFLWLFLIYSEIGQMLRGSAGSHGGRKRRTEYPLAGGKKRTGPV